nr:MAG TPA: ChiA1-BD-binding domain protein [Caudoviricetes sp.]
MQNIRGDGQRHVNNGDCKPVRVGTKKGDSLNHPHVGKGRQNNRFTQTKQRKMSAIVRETSEYVEMSDSITLCIVKDGKQGDGVVMAYKHADTQPDAPTGTDPEYPGDGWSLSPDAATAGEKVTDVRYGGYESGTYDGNNKGTDATAKEWAEAEDDGRTWMKSPSGLSNYGYAMMKVSFITQYDNTTVDVEIKAYSEQNYDLVEVWALDTAPSTGTSFRGQGLAHASGNGVEQAYSFTVAKAGRHFICVTYAKDISGDDNGDYGLFRLDLSDNEVAVSDTVWMSQAKVSGGKCVLPWSTPVKINGADGIGAFEILCDPETIVIDTDDNGLATGLDNAYASLMCLRDGKEVSGVTYKMGSRVNCEATVNTNTHVVAITRVDKQSVTVDGQTVEVSCTNGSVTVSVTDPTTKTTYVKTIPFTVNVAKFNGGLMADNKTLKSQYTELSNNAATKEELKQYDSKIEQTARNISLKVMEKSVGRRNLLPGSAFRKQGEGCSIVQDGQDAINGICINGGYDGVNCARLRNEGDAGAAYPRISWDGGRNSNVKVAKGKKYTLSFWAKRLSSTEGGYEISTQFFLQDGANGYARPYGALKFGSFTVKSQGEWEFIQDTVTIPSEAKSNYVEVCICLGLLQRGMAEILVCRPMLEEGEEYNGWTLSEQDYDYVGGNLLDNAGTLAKTGNVETLNPDNVTQGGMGESASIRAVLSPTDTNIDIDFLQFSTDGMGLKANEDYVLSFYAKAYTNPGRLQCYLYPSEGYTNTEEIEGGYDYFNPSDGRLQSGGIVPGTTWKRYWVHWRPTKADPKHVLFRLLRGGNDRDTYSSYTTYAVDDVVLYGGTYYRCIKAGQGNTPSSSSSYWEATWYGISLSKPKLEVGATMTEWTEKRSDMVDKQALYATGINIDIKEITLTASNTKFRDNDGNEMAVIDHDGLRATKIATTDNGGGHTEISGNSTVWFQKDGVTPGIAVFYDAAGVPHLAFYGTDGKQKYDIGPSGLQSLISSTQQAHSDTAYLRLATSAVKDYNSALSFDWLYVAKGQQADLRYIWRKQIPTTDASKNYDIYDGCVFTKNYYNTTNSVSWPNPNFLLPNGWYTEPNDGNLPMKLHMVDNEGVLDPTQTVYYQTFYYYEGGKVARTVRAYMKRTTSSQLVSKFEYAGSYYEI